MNNLAILEQKSSIISMWDNDDQLKQIKAIYAPKLTQSEFSVFVEMGKATSLNPFLREIWAVKYDEKAAAQIFIGRDGYRKSAQRHPFYDYHLSDAVYSNDDFEVINGEVQHRYKLGDRGILVGAYCNVKRKGSSRPTYVFVDIKEYNKNQSVWKDKPATMIKKVAETQGLRCAFQELFSGTYSEYEQWEINQNPIPRGINGLKTKLGIIDEPKNIDNFEVVNENNDKQNVNYQDEMDCILFLLEGASTIEELQKLANRAKSLPEEFKNPLREIYAKREKEIVEVNNIL